MLPREAGGAKLVRGAGGGCESSAGARAGTDGGDAGASAACAAAGACEGPAAGAGTGEAAVSNGVSEAPKGDLEAGLTGAASVKPGSGRPAVEDASAQAAAGSEARA